MLALCNIFRGSKSMPSIFGIEKCSSLDWGFLALFIVFCVFLTIFSTKKIRAEQCLKIRFGGGIQSYEVFLNKPNVLTLIFFSLFGGMIGSAVGLGGGAIFNPLLLNFGVPPKVASSTGMYMIIFSTAASSISYILNG